MVKKYISTKIKVAHATLKRARGLLVSHGRAAACELLWSGGGRILWMERNAVTPNAASTKRCLVWYLSRVLTRVLYILQLNSPGGPVFYVHLVLLMDEITHKQTRMLKLLPNMSVTLEQIHIFKNKYNRTDCTSLCLLMQFYSKINFISPLYYIWRIKHWCLEITCIDSLCYLWPSFHHNECEITKYFI